MTSKNDLGSLAFYCAPGALRSALRRGADPNEADPDTKVTPLMRLCEMHDHHVRKRKRMFRYLVKAGASLANTDANGATAWDYARSSASKGFKRFVKREYQRILGRVPGRTMLRSEVPSDA
jgi:hypothetical protein